MNSSRKIVLFALCCLGLAGCGGHNIRSANSRLPPPPMPAATDADDGAGSLRSRNAREAASYVPPAPPRAPEPDPIPVSTPVDSAANDANARRSVQLRDVYFDYNRSAVSTASVPVLAEDVEALQLMMQVPNNNVTIEGHADDRGSEEFNLALADHRATAVKEFLVQRGISAQRLNTVSFGKEKPQCREQNEACWSRNRRAHFTSAN